MFNSDQSDHMRYLSTLPPEAKCPCGWYPKWDCYTCNHAEFERRGGQVINAGRGKELRLPDGEPVGYIEMVAWLRGIAAPFS